MARDSVVAAAAAGAAEDGHWLVGNFTPGAVLEFDASWAHARTFTNPAMLGVNCVSVEPDGGLSVKDAVHGSVHFFDAARQYVSDLDHPTLIFPYGLLV